MIVWMKSDTLLGNFMNLLWTFRVFGFKLFPIMPMPYHWFKNKWKTLQTFWSRKPYIIIEWENWNGACNFSKEFILTEISRSDNIVQLKR